MKTRLTAILLLAATSAFGHRLDEYLQGALISVEKNRFEAEITLTPGVAVFSLVLAAIDSDGDGVISKTERRAYAEEVFRASLVRAPNNGWALYGLTEVYRKNGRKDAHAEVTRRLGRAWAGDRRRLDLVRL